VSTRQTVNILFFGKHQIAQLKFVRREILSKRQSDESIESDEKFQYL
jgi:hypothetical protein